MHNQAIERIHTLIGFQHKSDSIIYLGIPLFKGRSKVPHFKFLLDKINAKLMGWQSKFLSQAGRLSLIKSVISAIPIYTVSSTSIPYTISKQVECICANFFWQGLESVHKRHWVHWDKICYPQSMGGLGVRSLRDIQICSYVKHLWSSLHNNSLWAKYIRKKYIKGQHISDCRIPFPAGIKHKDFRKAISILLAGMRTIVFNGVNTNFIKDNWFKGNSITDLLSHQIEP